MKECLIDLIRVYGNAMFECGEYDNEDHKAFKVGYEELMKISQDAKENLIEFIDTRMVKGEG